jgi:hypothetical protein
MKRLMTVGMVAGVLALATAAAAMPLQGTAGKDWDAVTFEVPPGGRAIVTIENYAKGGPYSTVTTIYELDGKQQTAASSGELGKVTEIVLTPGPHAVMAQCHNRGADAVSCRITVTGAVATHIN